MVAIIHTLIGLSFVTRLKFAVNDLLIALAISMIFNFVCIGFNSYLLLAYVFRVHKDLKDKRIASLEERLAIKLDIDKLREEYLNRNKKDE